MKGQFAGAPIFVLSNGFEPPNSRVALLRFPQAIVC